MADHDGHAMRGRKRDRSLTRTSVSNRPMRADESSTLRGRSRQRATSPQGAASRNASPSLMSPTRHRLLYNRIRDSRREHCPSRPASPSRKTTMRRRTRSRSRGPRRELDSYHNHNQHGHRGAEQHSGLRNEVLVREDGVGEKETG